MQLLRHQKTALDFILSSKRGCALCDSAGTGKTLPALLAAEKLTRQGQVCLWITLNSLKYQLKGEIERFKIALEPFILTGTAHNRQKILSSLPISSGAILIMNYEQVLNNPDMLKILQFPISVIITDECTRMLNSRNKTYKRIYKLAQMTGARKIGLSGTPIINSPMDAFSLFDYLNPRSLGNYFFFGTRYMKKTPFSLFGEVRKEMLPELACRLAPYYLRRDRETLLPDLPELMEEEIPVIMSAEESRFYSRLMAGLLLDIKREDLSKVENKGSLAFGITKFLRLRQACGSLSLLGENSNSSKLKALKDFLETTKEEKVIIFSEFSEMCKLINADLPGSRMIIGETPNDLRDKILKEFNENPNVKILIMSGKVGEMGLNLQVASYVIHYDPPLSWASYDQRIARARRKGQKSAVVSVRLFCYNSVESRIYTLIEKKKNISLMAMPFNELERELL